MFACWRIQRLSNYSGCRLITNPFLDVDTLAYAMPFLHVDAICIGAIQAMVGWSDGVVTRRKVQAALRQWMRA